MGILIQYVWDKVDDKDKDRVDQMQNDRHLINARNGSGSNEDVLLQ